VEQGLLSAKSLLNTPSYFNGVEQGLLSAKSLLNTPGFVHGASQQQWNCKAIHWKVKQRVHLICFRESFAIL
jgi:hypothetical protein